jgi:hypothetical protein
MILLWSLRMTPDEYWMAVYEQEKARIDHLNAKG